MKKQATLLLSLLTLVMMLPGCGIGNKSANPGTNISPSVPSEPLASITPTPTVPQTVSTQEVPAPQDGRTVFQSDYGYSISYEAERFDYRRTEGYDEFILKSDETDKPFVFVCISHIGAEFVETVATASLGDKPESCMIGQTDVRCMETEEAWESGRIIRKNYLYPLTSGDALLIETQWYTQQGDDPYATRLQEMVCSVTV